jgi:thiol:disulfide interchange protein DsbA
MRFGFELRRIVIGAVVFVGLAVAQAQPLTAGKDYQLITPAQPAPAGKSVEVIEFFWYGCPHCAQLQPSLAQWLKKKPADVTFRGQPAAFDEGWTQLARAYYAMEVMGVQDKLHQALFDALHKSKKLNPATLLKDAKPLFDWVGAQQIDVKKFTEAYNSFSVVSKAKRTIDSTSAYGVSGTPSLAIDGRYLIAPGMVPSKNNMVDYERFFQNVDQLIAMARASRAGKK